MILRLSTYVEVNNSADPELAKAKLEALSLYIIKKYWGQQLFLEEDYADTQTILRNRMNKATRKLELEIEDQVEVIDFLSQDEVLEKMRVNKNYNSSVSSLRNHQSGKHKNLKRKEPKSPK